MNECDHCHRWHRARLGRTCPWCGFRSGARMREYGDPRHQERPERRAKKLGASAADEDSAGIYKQIGCL